MRNSAKTKTASSVAAAATRLRFVGAKLVLHHATAVPLRKRSDTGGREVDGLDVGKVDIRLTPC